MIRELSENPGKFDFFQAVRLLERHFDSRSAGDERESRAAVGGDAHPAREAVRFRSLPSMSFSPAPIAKLTAVPPRGDVNSPPPEMTVTFIGLTGPSGALPHHYTALLLSRLRERDSALYEFLDLFHHRIVSHFYRAWEKNRFPVLWERHQRSSTGGDDSFSAILSSLIGFGTSGQRERMDVPDDVLRFFGGQFTNRVRPAGELQRILAEQFRVDVEVRQFHGRWLVLEDADRTRLATDDRSREFHNRLGEDTVIGERVWDVQGSFRLVVGPVEFSTFEDFMPSGRKLRALSQLTRAFVGPEFDFDVQVVLAAGEVPECRIDSTQTKGPCLGWNTWLRSRAMETENNDGVFALAET